MVQTVKQPKIITEKVEWHFHECPECNMVFHRHGVQADCKDTYITRCNDCRVKAGEKLVIFDNKL